MPPPIESLTPPQAMLLAVHLASAADLQRLQVLIAAHPKVFPTTTENDTLLRVLLCLPETTPPDAYTPLLNAVLDGKPLDPPEANADTAVDTTPVEKLTSPRCEQKLSQLLPPQLLQTPAPASDLITAFLVQRSERIDAETGLLSIIAELLAHYTARLPGIAALRADVSVLSTLVYTSPREPVPSLTTFRSLPVEEALEVLVADPSTVSRDLEALVVPYLGVREGGWDAVWARLGALPFSRVVGVVKDWAPPEEGGVRRAFVAWAVMVCYRCTETGAGVWEGMRAVQRRVAGLVGGGEGKVPEVLGDLSDENNPLFAALGLLDVGITAAAMLGRPLAETVRLRLGGSREVQSAVLRQFVRPGTEWSKRDDEAWERVRDGARWLRRKAQVLGRLEAEEVERVVLAGMLAGMRFGLVRDVYVTSNQTADISLDEVEKCVLAAFNDFVDNATNGNKTRGSMKHALQAYAPSRSVCYIAANKHPSIKTIYPHASNSPALSRANSLISAIHSLSNYTIPSSNRTTPLLPVQIRIHPDPLSLLSKLLSSNPRSYQRSDSLIQIGSDLVHGTGGSEADTAAAVPRILGMCAEAALGEDDFESAYAYITSRLLPAATSRNEAARSTLWRTALLAGRFQSPYAVLSGTGPRGPAGLANLEKKRELLAWALAYCPAEAAADVLGSWRRNEGEIEVLMEAEELAEEEHARLGGGVAQRRMSVVRDGEAPQSLFEVAKGAARVFSSGVGAGITAPAKEGQERERKRDVVGGMVTRGIVGGLGWVLGAQPNVEVRQRG